MRETAFRMSLMILVLLCSAPVVAQPTFGVWKVTQGEMSGQSVPSAALEDMTLTIFPPQFTAKSATNESSGKMVLNLREAPPKITFSIAKGADSGREIKAIYRMLGEQLQIVFSPDDNFPSGFNSSPDNDAVLLNYELVQQFDGQGRPKKQRNVTIMSTGAGGSLPDSRGKDE